MTSQQTQMTTTPAATPKATAPAPGAKPSGGGPLGAWMVVLVSLFLYWPTTEYQLVYDDLFLISPDLNGSMEPVVKDLSAAFDLFGQEYWENVNPDQAPELRTRGQALYRPLTVFIWAATLNLWHDHVPGQPFDGTRGAAYHWISVIVNALVVLLLYRVVLRLFGNNRLALLSALVYALHPLHSEAVAYVAGLSDQLATLTVVGGLLLFERATRDTGFKPVATFFLVLVFFVGLLAKESAVLLLAACALTDLMWALRGRAVGFGRRLAVYGSMLAALGAHIWIRWLAMGYLTPDTKLISRLDNVLINVEPFERAFNACKLIAKYVWLVLWPKEQSIDYSFSAITVSPEWTNPEPLAGIILVAAMLVLGLVKLRRSPALGWGLLLFLGCTIFTSNMLMPIGTVFAERLMYLPTLGAAVVLGLVLDALVGGKASGRANPVGLLLVVVGLGLLGVRTWERNMDFRNSLRLFETAKDVTPESARVRYQLGTLYSNLQLYGQATEELQMALEYDNTLIQAAVRLGDVHMVDRNFQKADEIFSQVLANVQATGSIQTHLSAVRSLVLRKRSDARRAKGDLQAAQADLEAAMTLGASETPDTASQLARLLQGQDRYAESIPVVQRGLGADPLNVDLLLLMARAAVAEQDETNYEEALLRLETTEFGRAVALTMRAEVLYEQAAAAQDRTKRDEALAMFEEAISINGRIATPYYFRGRYLVESTRAYYDAIIQYDLALEREPRHSAALFYKAAAQIQVQDAEGALATLQQLETVNPNVACYALMAESYFMLGDLAGQEAMNSKVSELGKEPLQMTLNRALSFQLAGDTARALQLLEQELVNPESATNPTLLRSYALLLLDSGRCDEALAHFQQQGLALGNLADAEPDVFLPVNRARALLCLGNHAEAAAELDFAEATLGGMADRPQLQRQLRVSVLQWRGRLALAMGQPETAAQLAAEGIEATNRGHPPLFDLSIEALAAMGDLDAALIRAREGETLFFKLGHYPVMVAALQTALTGDGAGAAATLRAFEGQLKHSDGLASCEALAETLGG